MLTDDLLTEAEALLRAFRKRGLMLATAESCTGGLIAAAVTSIAGSSDVLDRGYVTYSNRAKTEMLDVPVALIEAHGAVSEAVAVSMAAGAVARSVADIAVSVTGIAGPGGGSADKPVGTVCFGIASRRGEATAERRLFPGDRAAIRLAAAIHAMRLAMDRAGVNRPG